MGTAGCSPSGTLAQGRRICGLRGVLRAASGLRGYGGPGFLTAFFKYLWRSLWPLWIWVCTRLRPGPGSLPQGLLQDVLPDGTRPRKPRGRGDGAERKAIQDPRDLIRAPCLAF